MPVRDLKDNLANDLAFYNEFISSTTEAGQTLDTAHYDGGIMFAFAAPAWSDGTYTPVLEESDESGSGFTAIPADQLIGTIADVTLSAATAVGDAMPTIGLLSTKRYVKVSVTSSGVSSGATIVAVTGKLPEEKPVV